MAKAQATQEVVLPEVPSTVSSESQEVASAVLPEVLPAGVAMLSPSVSDNGVEPGTSVTLPDGTVITHN